MSKSISIAAACGVVVLLGGCVVDWTKTPTESVWLVDGTTLMMPKSQALGTASPRAPQPAPTPAR